MDSAGSSGSSATQKEKKMNEEVLYHYKGYIDHIVDGDTVDLLISLGLDVYAKERFRLYGIDTPEIHGISHQSDEYKRGMAAMEFLVSLIGRKEVFVKTHKDEKGKYGRYLAEIFLPADDEGADLNVNDLMIEKGHAVPYFGGKR